MKHKSELPINCLHESKTVSLKRRAIKLATRLTKRAFLVSYNWATMDPSYSIVETKIFNSASQLGQFWCNILLPKRKKSINQ